MKGTPFCRSHGGLERRQGRYANEVPARLLGSYAEAIRDADVLSLHSEAAVVQAMIAEALSKVDLVECQAAWESLEILAAQAREAKGAGANSKRGGLAMEMAAVIAQGVAPWEQMGRVLGYIERKRSLAETEGRRIRAAGSRMSPRESESLVAALAEAVWKEFEDQPERVARVSANLAFIFGQRGGGAVKPPA